MRYSHADPSQYAAWRVNLRAKLDADGHLYPSEIAQAFYTYSRLEGIAAQRVLPWIEDPLTHGIHNMKQFLARLDLLFRDPHEGARSLAALQALRQASRPFREYWAEFQQHLARAGGFDWAPQVQIQYLEQGLWYRLREALVSTPRPATLDQFAVTASEVYDRIQRLNIANRTGGGQGSGTRSGGQQPPNHNRTNVSDPDVMQIGAGQIANGERRSRRQNR
jgi:hypothetical protein